MAKKRKRQAGGKCKTCGISTQVMICFFNGLLWLSSIAVFGFGLVLGLYSKTLGISQDFHWLDWLITTPATIFMYYGLFIFIIGISGCFASVSGNYCCTIFYIILIVVFICFDIFLGISFAFPLDSYNKFLGRMKDSERGYMEANSPGFGVIPILLTPTIFWSHFQMKGKCCGLKSYREWRNVPYAKANMSIPDSCCEDAFKGCGQGFFEDEDEDDVGEWDDMTQNSTKNRSVIINNKGCLSVFSPVLRNDTNQTMDYSGKGVLAVLLLCATLSIVLIFLVACRLFKPAQGLTNPEFMRSPIAPQCRVPSRRGRRRVHPETTTPTPTTNVGSKEQKDAHNNNPSDKDKSAVSDNNNDERKVSFDYTGPKIMPPARLNVVKL